MTHLEQPFDSSKVYPAKETTFDATMLRVGDVFIHEGRAVVVRHVNESAATVQPFSRKEKTVTARDLANGETSKEIKFSVPERVFRVSSHAEVTLLARLGDDWEVKKHTIEIPGLVVSNQHTGQKDTSGMKKQAIKNPRGGLAAEAKADAAAAKAAKKTKKDGANAGGTRKGSLGELFGCSVTSVLRALGKAGVTAAEARGIMKAKGIKIADATVQIQIGHGKNKTELEPAKLTGEQLAELKALIPEEKKEEAAAK